VFCVLRISESAASIFKVEQHVMEKKQSVIQWK
jgi:hypothetical protein